MKRRIIIGLAAYSLVFLLASVYLLTIVNGSVAKLDKLLMLHQVEILREQYLIQIRQVQMDLALRDTRHSANFETFVSHTRRMGQVIESCFSCHHEGPVFSRIQELKERTDSYKEALSRVLTIRANAERLAGEEGEAFHIGEALTQEVSDMIAITSAHLEMRRAQAMREIGRSRYVLYLLVGFAPLVSAFLGFVFISGLTRPLHVLLDSTRTLKAGNLDHRVTGLKDEFGELAEQFNAMAGSLKEQMLKMRRAEQLAVVGELSAGLAHEIKNPLAGIKVAMEVLAKEADLSGQDALVLEKVGAEITRLETLMKSFLNFAKPPKPQLAEVNVNTVIGTTLAFYATSNKAARNPDRRIEIVKDFGQVPVTLADAMQLEQVFLNLLINAVDAMPDGGTLTVRTSHDAARDIVAVAIADTGKGIDPEFADKIFQPFFTTKRGGTGLGLPITRQLIEQHGGTVTAAAQPGGGTVFTIELPVRSAARTGAV